MEFRHKIFEGLKNTPEGWRFCNCWDKRAKYEGSQYDTPYTLEEVLNKKGNGVGVLLGRHSTTTIEGKKYGLGAVDFDGTGSDITFKHHLGFDPHILPHTVSVTSGKKDRKQIFFWIPEERIDKLAGKKIYLDGYAHFELRIGNMYSMVAGAHDETEGYYWINDPADNAIAIAPLHLLDGWERVSPRCKKKVFGRRIKREKHIIQKDISRVEKYLERYYVPANNYSDYESWLKVLMALHHLSLEWEEWTGVKDKCLEHAHRWSYEMNNYDAQELQQKWDSFSKDLDDEGVITIGTFFHNAKKHENWIKDEVRFQGDQKEKPKRKRSELLKDLLDSAISGTEEDMDKYYEDFAEMQERFKRKPDDINIDLLHRLRDRYSNKTFTVGAIDMSKVKKLRYILEGYLIKGEIHLLYGGRGSGKTSLVGGMIKAGYREKGFLDQVRHRPKFTTLFIQSDGGASRFLEVYEELGLSEEMVETWGGDVAQGKKNWKLDIPNIIQLKERCERGDIGLIAIDSVIGMLSSSPFKYTDNDQVDIINQFLREIILEPYGIALVLLSHMNAQRTDASGAQRWGQVAGSVIEVKPSKSGDRENHNQRNLCKWKDPISGRKFLEYKLSGGVFSPVHAIDIAPDIYGAIKKFAQEKNFQTGKSVFTREELMEGIKGSESQIDKMAKEHFEKGGIFKKQFDSNGKWIRATYVLKNQFKINKTDNSI